MKILYLIFFINLFNEKECSVKNSLGHDEIKSVPRIVIPLLIRNKAHALPYFFTYLENLDYPKDRISLWIRLDHTEDNSLEITKLWLKRTENLYHNVDFSYETTPSSYNDSAKVTDWTKQRFTRIITLKEEAFSHAKRLWADFVFFVDVDAFLVNPKTLTKLVEFNVPLIAPLLHSPNNIYSNFWAASEAYYYKSDPLYYQIIDRKDSLGEFEVPMIHSAVLINLNYEKSKYLTYSKEKLIANQIEANIHIDSTKVPLDDIIILAASAKNFNIPMMISNTELYGFIMVPNVGNLESDIKQMTYVKTSIITKFDDLLLNEEFKNFVPRLPEKSKLSFDNIYMINLKRRTERRIKMEKLLNELGINYEYFEAVDGKSMTYDLINKMGIEFLEGYEDPYHGRKMKLGEVGCFLSHYYIWKQMIERGEKEVLILEDDVRFDFYFVENTLEALKQVRTIKWDFLYFGRKILEHKNEFLVDGLSNIASVKYSYWTVGYAITLEGAKKLVDAEPLKALIPVDEYIPVMFDQHPNSTWSEAFPNRNLIAYSANPLLLHPQLYIGESGYISDTENSLLTTKIVEASGQNNETGSIHLENDLKSELLGDSMIKRQKVEL